MAGRIETNEWGQAVLIHEESAAHALGVAEVCKARQKEGLTGDKDMRHLAEFPGILIQKYCDTAGIEWADWFNNPAHARRMLNDPDLSAFRIHRSRV